MAGGGQPPGRPSEPLPGEGSHPSKLHRSPRGGMAEDSLAWGWCRMVLQALEQGEDVTGKAIQQAKEVITSELPKREEPLPPEQVLGQQDREDDRAHGEGTDSEAPSHEKVKPSASPDQYLSIMSANVTSFNSGALEWVTSSKAKVVCLQETHLPELLH